MQKMNGKSLDILAENIAKLKQLFPEVVSEGKIDFELLKQVLGEYVDDAEERYSFSWNGKRQARMIAQTPSTGTLRPCREESVDWDTTKNIFIEGDNLEVLKLLQKSYHRKVKMIYIDPPYNTGKDFVYKDNFRDNIKNYKEITGQVDSEGRNLSSNPETSGRYHTDWLNMMYPRLKLARSLLKDDGVIFISIDDNEVANLRKMCDEIFGEENFIANIVWQKKYGPANDSKGVSQTHEHLLVFGKNSEDWHPGLIPRNEEQLKAFKNPDNDPRGRWRASDFSVKTYNENCDYEIIGPNGESYLPPASRAWVVNDQRYKELLADNRITFGTSGSGRPMQKKFLSEVKDGITPETWWGRDKVGDNKIARYQIKDLFPENVFDTPKPTKLISYAAGIANLGDDDVILDFFAGSATTAHAVMQLNAEDGGKRKFIMVQLPETTDENSEAHKAGYKTIADISKERIRRAAAQIKAEQQKSTQANTKGLFDDSAQDAQTVAQKPLDLGFKVFKLDSTNLKAWESDFSIDAQQLKAWVEHIKPERTEEDILYEVLLKYGLDLTLPISELTIAGHSVYNVGMGALIICMAEPLSLELVEGIAELKTTLKPEIMRVVFRDSAFGNDVVKTNAVQILKQAGIDDVRSI